MEVINSFEKYNASAPTVVTVGTFDGLHLGHQVILQQLFDTAQKIEAKSLLLTFFPHPRMVLQSDCMPIKLLQTIDERAEILAKTDLDYLLIEPFTKAIANLTDREFVRDILVEKLRVKNLILGYDHRFGKDRTGDFEVLTKYAKEFDFELTQIDAVKQKKIAVSSTKIRKLLISGAVNQANKYLGKFFTLKGKVVRGDRMGNKIGFPTANLQVNAEKIIPKNGVYVVSFLHGVKLFYGIMNIGFCPTLQKEKQTVEAHFFDFEGNLYGKNITVSVIDFLRDEQKFDGLLPLHKQLQKDKENALKKIAVFKNNR